MFFVKSLVTEAVAWEVLTSGNVGGARSRGGGRILEPVVDTTSYDQNPELLRRGRNTRTRPGSGELFLPLNSQCLVIHEDLPQ